MSTQSQSSVTVTIDGQSTGAWDSLSGGETSAEVTKRRTATGEKTYGAKSTNADITVSRGYERERDIALLARLRPRVGRAKAVITEQPLDDDDVPYGKPTIRVGRLISLNTGEYDSTSDEPRMCELGFIIEQAS